MKRFFFSLDPVLKQRSEREEKAIVEKSLAQQEYQKQVDILENIRSNLKRVRDAAYEKTADDILAGMLYFDYLKASLKKQGEVVDKAYQHVEKKMKALVEARKEKLVMHKLKEKQYQRYLKELNQWEAGIVNDQVTALTHRGRGDSII